MRSRHAAALALVGCYLMTAPVADRGAIIYQDAPLTQWTKAQHFESESDCEARRKQTIVDSQDQVELAPNSVADEDTKRETNVALNEALASQCVNDDDPRIADSKAPQTVPPGFFGKLAH